MQSSKAKAPPAPFHPEVPLVRAATAGWDTLPLVPTLGELIGHDTHARTAAAIRGAVQAIGSASTLALSVVATTLGDFPTQMQAQIAAQQLRAAGCTVKVAVNGSRAD